MIIVVRIAETVNTYLEKFLGKRPRIEVVCADCGGKTHGHGHYMRGVKEHSAGPDTKIPIYRVKCTVCNRTASLLPHFIRPHSGYSLFSHEEALGLYAASEKSLEEIAEERDLEPRTLRNWLSTFMGFFPQVASSLAQQILEISPGTSMILRTCNSSREYLGQFFLIAAEFSKRVREPMVFPAVHFVYLSPFLTC
jgi:hypothetical protein